ncbi:hypothetical protein GIB67_007135 [Kingdonia uniflora]|uniref:Uncharacterized protein n=1 Tax=Kingdonia uniflora TaxID=39325 RepID=A0A7J7MLU0_9MAGN|nr:hypothetical protein GIB67_007135 [Kingdonia uniflora]
MSEVVEVLKPLLDLKDMARSSYHFQAMQAERSGSMNGRNGLRTQAGFVTRNVQQPMRSLSVPNGSQARHHPSPKPTVK